MNYNYLIKKRIEIYLYFWLDDLKEKKKRERNIPLKNQNNNKNS